MTDEGQTAPEAPDGHVAVNPAESPPMGAEGAHAPDEVADVDPEVRRLRDESKRHRLRAKDAEMARDQLQGRVDAYQRREAAEVLGEHLNAGAASDFWLLHGIEDFRSDDGDLDVNALGKAAAKVAKERPHWAKPAVPRRDSGQGVRRSVSQADGFGARLKQAAGVR